MVAARRKHVIVIVASLVLLWTFQGKKYQNMVTVSTRSTLTSLDRNIVTVSTTHLTTLDTTTTLTTTLTSTSTSLDISQCELTYIRDRLNNSQAHSNIKIIYNAAKVVIGQGLRDAFKFDECDYSNCVFQYCDTGQYISEADAVIFDTDAKYATISLPPH